MPVEIYDVTLRDGLQRPDLASLSVDDRVKLAHQIVELGVDIIECGFLESDELSQETLEILSGERKAGKLGNAKIAVFGKTTKKYTSPSKDSSMTRLAKCPAEIVTLVGKACPNQVERVLETTLEENLRMIEKSIRYLKKHGKDVFFDAEHFFDGFYTDQLYAMKVLTTAVDAGASCIVLCDTNGCSDSDHVRLATKIICGAFEGIKIGIHAHNDLEMAVANSIMAVKAGAEHVQVTMNGWGERTGNACLSSVVAALDIHKKSSVPRTINLNKLTESSINAYEITNTTPNPYQPIVGELACVDTGGMHSAATNKWPMAYRGFDPEKYGNDSGAVISVMAGVGAVKKRAEKLLEGEEISREIAQKILRSIEEKTKNEGCNLAIAPATVDLMILDTMGRRKKLFEVAHWQVISEGNLKDSNSKATVVVVLDGKPVIGKGEAVGPVDALDKALRNVLDKTYPDLSHIKLTDYKVHIVKVHSGTDARVQVLIETSDEKSGKRSTTVSASENILLASLVADIEGSEKRIIAALKNGK